MERKQNLRSVTGKKKRYVMIACIAVMLVLATVLIIYAATHEKKSFHQPEMDSHAVEGTPQPDSGFLYGEVPTKYAYHFSMAANLYMCILQTHRKIQNFYVVKLPMQRVRKFCMRLV